jgi:hypothetical protein
MYIKRSGATGALIFLAAVPIAFAILSAGLTRTRASAVAVEVSPTAGEMYPRQQEEFKPPVQMANRDDVGTGRVLREVQDSKGNQQLLDLDTSPCKETNVVRFHRPYEKETIGRLDCLGKTFDKVKVVQK